MPSSLIEQSGRRTGKTTRAIHYAPYGAIFVCAGNAGARTYYRDLAAHLGRTDLRLVGADEVADVCRGSDYAVVVDPDAKLTPLTIAVVELHNETVRSRRKPSH